MTRSELPSPTSEPASIIAHALACGARLTLGTICELVHIKPRKWSDSLRRQVENELGKAGQTVIVVQDRGYNKHYEAAPVDQLPSSRRSY